MELNFQALRSAIDDAEPIVVMERLALAAGRIVMAFFGTGAEVRTKGDNSPVTEADCQAEAIIVDGLRRNFPGIAIVAEEAASAGLLPDELGQIFFLVDPLDGTKEFVNGRTDFTVNIAMIENGIPVAGVVFAPASGKLYSGAGRKAFLAVVDAGFSIVERTPITTRKRGGNLVAVASRSHRSPATDAYLAAQGITDCVSVGSSLKFCLVAEGVADVYPRFGRTMEWDTAAGDAVLRAAGGTTVFAADGTSAHYGKRNQQDDADFANPDFIGYA